MIQNCQEDVKISQVVIDLNFQSKSCFQLMHIVDKVHSLYLKINQIDDAVRKAFYTFTLELLKLFLFGSERSLRSEDVVSLSVGLWVGLSVPIMLYSSSEEFLRVPKSS